MKRPASYLGDAGLFLSPLITRPVDERRRSYQAFTKASAKKVRDEEAPECVDDENFTIEAKLSSPLKPTYRKRDHC